jgi:DNA-binding NarL/FixJ family response regulator
MGLPLLALLDDLGPAMLVVDYLENSAFELQARSSSGELWSAASRTPGSVAVVDWRRVGGLFNEVHQHYLADVDHAAPLVLLDDTFGQHRLAAADLGVTAVLDSPILRADLLAVLTAVAQGRSEAVQWPQRAALN